MAYYFIHMAAVASVILPHSIGQIFSHFFKCMGSHLCNGIMNNGLPMLNCL